MGFKDVFDELFLQSTRKKQTFLFQKRTSWRDFFCSKCPFSFCIFRYSRNITFRSSSFSKYIFNTFDEQSVRPSTTASALAISKFCVGAKPYEAIKKMYDLIGYSNRSLIIVASIILYTLGNIRSGKSPLKDKLAYEPVKIDYYNQNNHYHNHNHYRHHH